MAKRRILKKDINYISETLFSEVAVIRMLEKDVDADKANKLMARILDLREDFVKRSNTVDGKDNKKLVRAYYRSLNEALRKETAEIIAEIKELNKK